MIDEYINISESWWQYIRSLVLQRDEYKCHNCGYKKNLNIHHIDKKGWIYPVNNKSENLITLCSKCHMKEHK